MKQIDNNAWEILDCLYPVLRLAADYAIAIQSRIETLPEKSEYGDNFYATALTDADLTIQTTIELALLARFPEVRFFGEEYQTSYNTKYFRGIDLAEGELLVTLDPIDGTRAYLDKLDTFAIILTIIKGDHYEAVLIIKPKQKYYLLGLKNQGAYYGKLTQEKLDLNQPLTLAPLKSKLLYLSFGLSNLKDKFSSYFTTWSSAIDYNPPNNPPEYLDLITGNLAGVILEKGNLIDSAAISFVAKEAGAIVTLWDGKDFEPFSQVEPWKIPGIIIAHNQEIYEQIRFYLSYSRSQEGDTDYV